MSIKMEVKLLSITPNAEKHIERCTRICYNTEDRITNDSHINFFAGVIGRGHWSVLSHAHASFHIAGISRACSHQLVRHACLRYLQRSQRYCAEEFEFVLPPTIKGISETEILDEEDRTAFDALEDAAFTGWENYKEMMKKGIKKEDARYALTNACPTEIVVSGSLQAWWDFLRLRMSKSCQWELRTVAKRVYKVLQNECPNIFTEEFLMVQPKLNLEFPDG